MNIQQHLNNLVDLGMRGNLKFEKLQSTADQLGITTLGCADLLSLHVAHQYHSEALGFRACDDVMNALWGLLCSRPSAEIVLPDTTVEVFEAFDQGEYHHRGDTWDVDPDIKYTKPMVAAILARHENLNGLA